MPFLLDSTLFFLTFPSLLTNLFRYLFFSANYSSTPGGVCLNKKTPSHFKASFQYLWRREWDSNPRGPNGPQALKANAPLKGNCAFGPTRTG